MPTRPQPTDRSTDPSATAAQRFFAAEDLQEFKQTTGGVIQDAIGIWDELWAELESQKTDASTGSAQAEFEPSCGWSEFLQKMWVLRNHLNFVKRISR